MTKKKNVKTDIVLVASAKPKRVSRRRSGSKQPTTVVIKGKGDYVTDLLSSGHNVFTGRPRGNVNKHAANAGRVLGSAFGPIGGFLGEHAASGIATLLGHGDYTVDSNSIMRNATQIPEFAPSGTRWTEIEHREYLFDVISPAASPAWGVVQSVNLNPGIATTFPWLAGIAANYEEYKFDGLVVFYEATSSDYSGGSSQALGSVQIATQYDVLDTGFASQMEMLEYEFASSAKSSCSFAHPVECSPKDNPINKLYVRSGSVTTNALQLYDLGVTTVAVQGVGAANVNLGKIWISYRVKLGKPKLYAGQLGRTILFDHYVLSTTLTASAYFLAASLVNGSSLGSTLTSASTFKFPPTIQTGTYILLLQVTGSSAALTFPSIAYVNCVAGAGSAGKTLFNLSNTPMIEDASNHTSTIWVQQLMVTVTSQNATVTWGTGATLPGSISSGDLFVTQISSNVV